MKYEKLILNIPHASVDIPTEDNSYINENEKLETIYYLTDFFTDELFDISLKNCDKFVFKYSRVFCDIERFFKDEEEAMAQKGMGFYYTKGVNNIKFRNNSSRKLVEYHYHEYHKKLRNRIIEYNNKNIKPLLIDCHSFINKKLTNDGLANEIKEFPDICIGYDSSFGYNETVIKYLMNEFTKLNYSVKLNYPYSGSLYYNDLKHDSVMIEINKQLYLNTDNNKSDNFRNLKNEIDAILTKILF